MAVELIGEVSGELAAELNGLLPQLSRSATALSPQEWGEVVSQPGVFLFVFRSDDDFAHRALGMLSLATFRIPTGLRAWVEDVVVDEAARGQGAGAALVAAAVSHAHSLGCRTVDLTSRPSREAANRLYVRCGFAARQTNVYRHSSGA